MRLSRNPKLVCHANLGGSLSDECIWRRGDHKELCSQPKLVL